MTLSDGIYDYDGIRDFLQTQTGFGDPNAAKGRVWCETPLWQSVKRSKVARKAKKRTAEKAEKVVIEKGFDKIQQILQKRQPKTTPSRARQIHQMQ